MKEYVTKLNTATAGTVNADFQTKAENANFVQVAVRVVNNGATALVLKLQESDYPTPGTYYDVMLNGENIQITVAAGASVVEQLDDCMTRKSYRLTGTLGSGTVNTTVAIMARTTQN